MLAAAVELWLAQQQEAAGAYGYQWKSVFLPDGTVLRSWCHGQHNYAHVKGDQIIYEGRAVSPNQFARAFARTTRNAWADLYIRRPGDQKFKPACLLRQEAEQAEREPKVPAPRTPATAPTISLPVADESIPALALALAAALAQFAPPRDTDSGPRWDLPERRKFRYRLEDVVYE